MGADKARLPWDGEPMALVVARTLSRVCDAVSIVRRSDDGWPLPVVVDAAHEGTHPLFGVAAALAAARSEIALVLSCDVPRIRADSLWRLLESAPAVAFDGERRHPLVAALPRSWADRALAEAIAGGRARDFVASCRAVDVPASELTNVNRPGDRPGVPSGVVPPEGLR